MPTVVEAISIPSAQTRFQIPTGEITEEKTIGDQWPKEADLPWKPDCSNSTNCKEYNGSEDSGVLTTTPALGLVDNVEVEHSIGFHLEDSKELVDKTVYITDATGLTGLILSASNEDRYPFDDGSNTPAHNARGNVLVIDILDKTDPVDVTGTNQLLMLAATVSAVANVKGGAVDNKTLIRNGNFNVKDGIYNAGWHIAGASVYEATQGVSDNAVVMENTTLTMDDSNTLDNATSIAGARTAIVSNGFDVETNRNSIWIKESNLELCVVAGAWNSGAGIVKSSENSVFIERSTLNVNTSAKIGNTFTGIYGSWGDGTSQNNWVEITDSTLNIDGNKAYTIAGSMGAASSQNNVVLIRSTELDSRTTNVTQILGGHSNDGAANGNTVLFSDSVIDGTAATIYGGFTGGAESANENNLYLLNSQIGAKVVLIGGQANSIGDTASAARNHIVLKNVSSIGGGQANFDRLMGGTIGKGATYDGNTLTSDSSFRTKVLEGFQHYNFILNQDSFQYGAFINVTDTASAVMIQTEGDQLSTIAIGGSGFDLTAGGSYTLIDSAAGFVDINGDKLDESADFSNVKQDLVVENLPSVIRVETTTITKDDYDLSIVDEDHDGLNQDLVLDIKGSGSTSSSINSETDALMESSLSTMTTHFAADDLFVDAVLRSRDGKRDGLFTAARGGKWSYDTRSRIENNIVSGLLGYGAKLSNDLTMGAFIEMGHGSYDTRTHVAGSTKAGGGSHNYGGLGLFGDYAMPSIEGLHFTGYVKLGLLRNEFNSNIAGANVDYDRTGVYWGAHLGTHYDWDLTQSIRSRVFLSYFYDGQGDESFDIAGEGDVGGAHVSYDAIHAHRVQLGSMFEFAVSNTWRPYLGLTFEQILAAEAKGTATDAQGTMDLNSSDLEGSTGILSAGWTYQAGNFSTELGLNGYAGTRNGVSGQIQANWKF